MTGPIRSFAADFAALVERSGQNPAMIDAQSGRTFTYAELGALVGRARLAIEQGGLQPGATVLSLLPNSTEAIVLFLAAIGNGYDYAPLPPDAVLPEIERAVGLVKPAVAFVAETVSPDVADLLKANGVRLLQVPIVGTFDWLPDRQPRELPGPGRSARLYLATSGSTGDPKAIVMDVDRLWSSGRAFILRHRFVDEKARFYNILPVSYLGGLFNLCLIPMAAGASFVVADAFSGRTMLGFWQAVEQHGVNVLWVVPSIVRALLTIADRIGRTALSGPKLAGCFVGTASIDLETKQRFERFIGVPVLENYALSETTFLTTEVVDDFLPRSATSVGAVLPYVSMKFAPIADEDDDEDEPTVGEPPTEIRVRTPYLFLGYLGPDGSLTLPLDEDGYFPTGDLGHLEDGTVLVFDGRLRDVVKKGGFFVPLREIEILAEGHEAVEEAATVAVTHEFYGESYQLFVTLKPEHRNADNVLSQIGTWLRSRLVRHKWPDSIAVVEQFPRTSSGKIRKAKLLAGEPV